MHRAITIVLYLILSQAIGIAWDIVIRIIGGHFPLQPDLTKSLTFCVIFVFEPIISAGGAALYLKPLKPMDTWPLVFGAWAETILLSHQVVPLNYYWLNIIIAPLTGIIVLFVVTSKAKNNLRSSS